VPVVEKRRIGLVNASPLDMGILTEQGAPEWHPAPAEIRQAGKKVAKLCRDRGSSVSELALRFLSRSSAVSVTLVGMATRYRFEANLSLLQATTDRELLNEVRILLSQSSMVLGRRGGKKMKTEHLEAQPSGACGPENTDRWDQERRVP
jgi:L-galactose dehydrogenase